MNSKKRVSFTWALYLLWAIFLNAVNQWIIIPLAEDYAIYGVVVIVLLIVLWLTSIPRMARKKWISFSLFSLFLGYGLSSISNYPSVSRLVLGTVITIGLFLITWLYSRAKGVHVALGALGIIAVNWWLPVNEWSFLTHFSVSYYGQLSLQTSDFPALPLAVISTSNGQAVVTVENYRETNLNFEKAAVQAVESPNALQDLLQNYNHLYKFVTVDEHNGHFSMHPTTVKELAKVNINNLVDTFFPFERADWRVLNGHVIQYMSPSFSPAVLAQMVNSPANFPTNAVTLSSAVAGQERQNWSLLLRTLGTSPQQPSLVITNGILEGQVHGHRIRLPVPDSVVVGFGSFTSAKAQEVVLQGANRIDVVDLNQGEGRLVSTYHGSPSQPLSNDLVVGPLTPTGPDAIFVNSSPAYILQATGGQWKVQYTAPNLSLRFEASVRFKGFAGPEIITDDPSYIRNSPTRYFTSYTFRPGVNHGQLVRNWRVYHTNLVNVHPVQFQSGAAPYLVTAVYGTGRFLVLKRSTLPILPATLVLLALSLILGWGIRLYGSRGGDRNA